ncbi:MAG: PfkB family carbohydrate kinase [Spirochaetaceae bacterium]
MSNNDAERRIVIWGAGKIGRGFVADLFHQGGYALTFVDAAEDLVSSLRARGRYTVVKLPADAAESRNEISGFEAFSISETSEVDRRVATVPLVAVVVFPAIFDAVATELARGIERRAVERPTEPLDIILCANAAHPAKEFGPLLRQKLTESARSYFDEHVGLAETVILRIGIPPGEDHLQEDPLVVVTNGYPHMPIDETAFRGGFPNVPGLVPTDRIEAEEIRKIYCYNMAHAALGYAGYLKGYTFVSEAGSDPEVASEVNGALKEVAQGLAAEYPFSIEEMEEFIQGVVPYLSNPALPDTVGRVAGDPKRKLRRNDRLIGPALMCRAHSIPPIQLMRIVAKAFLFGDDRASLPDDPSAGEVQRLLRLKGIDWCLQELCGLAEEEDLKAIARDHLAELLGARPSEEERAAGSGLAPTPAPEAVVAGHICLDISPKFEREDAIPIQELFRPGTLIGMKGVELSPGGAVSNTGTSLAKLGVPTALSAKVGDDALAEILRAKLAPLADSTGVHAIGGARTSYTVIIAPPGTDRVFLHDTGANDEFTAADVDYEALDAVRLFHFGYPPAMRRMHLDEGKELERLLRLAKERGVTVSLDLSVPAEGSESGRAPWPRVLERALPYVDVFLPSVEELAFMVAPELHDRIRAAAERTDPTEAVTPDDLMHLGEWILDRGVAVAGIKCGVNGFFLATGSDHALSRAGRAAPQNASWVERRLYSASYHLDHVASGTGAGDASIAGFLAAMLRNAGPEEALNMACATGAAAATEYDATSGVKEYAELRARFLEKTPKKRVTIESDGWTYDQATRLWRAPGDGSV